MRGPSETTLSTAVFAGGLLFFVFSVSGLHSPRPPRPMTGRASPRPVIRDVAGAVTRAAADAKLRPLLSFTAGADDVRIEARGDLRTAIAFLGRAQAATALQSIALSAVDDSGAVRMTAVFRGAPSAIGPSANPDLGDSPFRARVPTAPPAKRPRATRRRDDAAAREAAARDARRVAELREADRVATIRRTLEAYRLAGLAADAKGPLAIVERSSGSGQGTVMLRIGEAVDGTTLVSIDRSRGAATIASGDVSAELTFGSAP